MANQTAENGSRISAAQGPTQGTTGSPFAVPSISLPKGGGAIRGMGEKFAANPVTGSGSMNVPIAVSPGRSGFAPQLLLSYDSSAGNGPFGLGWSLSLPSITRKTDKGIPKYQDGEDPDVFILSGAEDLVPVFDSAGKIVETDRDGYRIRRYRPRIEGLFARIERWTRLTDGDTHWRSISKENLLTLYGKDAESRIADPQDDSRVFSWLICETRDDKGNGILYEHVAEDAANVDLTQANEQNRGDLESVLRKANRYPKRILYGNRNSLLDAGGRRASFLTDDLRNNANWMFEVVFDYGDEDYVELPEDAQKRRFVQASLDKAKAKVWAARSDPFSSYRSGFEVRTYRLCQRTLLFHHFPVELKVADYLVRSTEFQFNQTPLASFITSVAQSGYIRQADGAWLKKSLPPVEFEYSEAVIEEKLREVDGESLENLPAGLDGSNYQWIDLDGDGVGGVLSEQAGAWFYKRNLSPQTSVLEDGVARVVAQLAPVETITPMPSLKGEGMQFLDLAGDGLPDLARFDGPTPGFYEHAEEGTWTTHQAFISLPDINWHDPNVKFIDLTGDGHADILVSEAGVFTWYPSRAEAGFGSSERFAQPFDDEEGPRLVFADSAQSIYLADLSGDGLTDIVRIRNGEVCYWPNLGYGRFGTKVTMDNSPLFDRPDQFDQRRIRLADIDGSGVTDIIYLHGDGVRLYFNQSGNSWSDARTLAVFPRTDSLSSVAAVDLLGNGTACLVWSSALPGNARQSMFYVDLMGGQKPHLLIASRNNLGAETRMRYAPSTKFYLADKYAGQPWITKLPFPVHVLERVETYDRISNNRFVTRYAYHHGYFDGEEREFRGFGMVEQQDTEEFAALTAAGVLANAANGDAASHVPPMLTRTWFHTGAFIESGGISKQFEHEYYREGDASDLAAGLGDDQLRTQLLDDTPLPVNIQNQDGTRTAYSLTPEETLEACRSLKGSILRQEVYALDGIDESDRPYTVSERNYTVEMFQPRGANKHAVFFTHPREQLDFHYERVLIDVVGVKRADPRMSHTLTLEVDVFGSVLRSIAIAYRRRELPGVDAPEQKETHLTLAANRFANRPDEADWYRIALAVEARTYEIVKPPEPDVVESRVVPFGFETMRRLAAGLFPVGDPDPEAAKTWPYERWDWRTNFANAAPDTRLRLVEHLRTLYRKDDLTAFSPLGTIESAGLPGEAYKLALTPGLVSSVFKRVQGGDPPEDLLPDPGAVLEGTGADQGGFVQLDGAWWIPSGRMFFDPAANVANPNVTAVQELAAARSDFFLPRKFTDPFGQTAQVDYDNHRFREVRTQDALGNITESTCDYRVLQPDLVTDPNRNRTAAAFDALGMVVATAVMGKNGQSVGDMLEDLNGDAPLAVLQNFCADPDGQAALLLGKATEVIVYDIDRFQRCGQPSFAASLSRETHFSDPDGEHTKIQIRFSYSDGFGTEIQRKIQAEGGATPQRQADVLLPGGDIGPGELIRGIDGKPVLAGSPRRWTGTGRTVFNNKGKPVRQYEPFFSATQLYEEEREMTDTGVSSVFFYDPIQRAIAILRPNHTYEKVVFDAWRQRSYDTNDTVAPSGVETGDPRTDSDIKGYVAEYFKAQPDDWQTWHAQRIGNQMGAAERDAAQKAAAHADTPAVAHFDTLGRVFLTVADNGPDPAHPAQHLLFATRVLLDIESNQREVRDAKDRVVMRYDYDLLSTRIHQTGMEAGARWMLNDAGGKRIRMWDSRRFIRRMTYDELRRPAGVFVTENGVERLAVRTVYGESLGDADNHRTRVHQVFDGAGIMTSEVYDFKGNLLRTRRELLPGYKQAVNWLQNPVANDGVFITTTNYDALNRAVTVTTPDNSIYRPAFNEANMLNRVDVTLRGAAVATPFVTNIDYNAKGQRESIAYGNGAGTSYEYDPLTFRMTKLITTRPANPDAVALQLFNGAALVQDLRYVYDPSGNITRIEDAALKTIVNNGEQVDPVCSYTYDATYRLIEAHGREHVGQTALDFNPPNGNRRDFPFVGARANPNDLQAMRNYTEQYQYDEVGNFELVSHIVANGGGWSCGYDYGEASLLEPAKIGNRVTRTTTSGFTETYTYKDAQSAEVHGCITAINAMKMDWDFEDQLQRVDLGGGGAAYYVYDAGGQRLRKVIETQNGVRREERIYLGRLEVYRDYSGGAGSKLERETLHVTDDKQRIALVETKTFENGNPIAAPEPLQRYQLGNHLASAALELADDATLISYEEHSPYGTTSFQAGRTAAELSLKRYRYTGKERDEETGFTYHGARYYAPWLRRWTSCDPSGIDDGVNVYAYVANKPINHIDPDGKANTPIHEHLTTLVASQYVDIETARKIGVAANAPDTEDKYDSVKNSFFGDPDEINKNIHVLGRGTRKEKVDSTIARYSVRNLDKLNQSEKIKDAGINLLHPLQDANYHIPKYTYGRGAGHGLFPEADLAVGEKTFEQFYQVVANTERSVELMRKKGVIGGGGKHEITKAQWKDIYNDLKAIESKYSLTFDTLNVVGFLARLTGPLAGLIGGGLVAEILAIGRFFGALFTGHNVAEGASKWAEIGSISGQAIFGVGLGTIASLGTQPLKDALRTEVANKQSYYLRKKIEEIESAKSTKNP
jgi:RHS repeat-associated protein